MNNFQLLTLIIIIMKKKNYFSKMKGIGRTCLLMVALSATTLAFADITTGLKLHYTFDGASGVVTDVTGNGFDGSLMAGAVTAPGYAGDAISLPTVADYVQLPAGITGDLNDFTIATWVKVDALNTWGRIFDFGTSTADYMFLCSTNGSVVRFAFLNNSGSTVGEQGINGTALPIGQWVHVAITVAYVDGVGTGTMYINGVAVGTNNAITITPAMLDAATLAPTPNNFLGKSQWPDPALAGYLDDFRIYRRALTGDDILELNGTPAELVTQWKALNIVGDLTNVTANLTLPTTMGTNGVTVTWASTNKAVIDTLGNVTRPAKFDAVVILTATVSLTVNAKTYTLQKVFNTSVPALVVQSEEIAKWNFVSANLAMSGGVTTVKDEFANGYVGTVMNEARIRTIGTTAKFNVLDLGNGTGYFDMGPAIGEQIYSLNNYTMSAFFRVDATNTDLNSNGNFIWTFSNSADSPTDMNGYIIGSLKNQSISCSSGYWKVGDQAVGKGSNAPMASANAADKIGWHHIAFVQNGAAGTVYLDGVSIATGPMANPPSIQLPKPGFTGTPFNWLGRSCYPTDAYLKKTLIYGFTLYRFALSVSDITELLNVPTIISNLNNAYAQDSDYKSPALANEVLNLTLPDLSAVTSNITLPSNGTLDNTIGIAWKSNIPAVITNAGVVTRPNIYNVNVILTATLTKDLATATKSFPATVVANTGTQFTNDLLVKYDFKTVASDTVVTDAAERHFIGVARKGATIKTIGITAPVKVLALGDSIGYFDMGSEMGNVLTHLNNYTMGAFFRVDDAYTGFTSNGNFLWNFSNSKDAGAEANGYLYAGLKNQNVCITATHWAGEKQVTLAANALKGGWHHIAYTQSDTIGTIYIDGFPAISGTVKLLPSAALTKDGFAGTLYNWIGRSCYVGDNNLRKTLVSDFRIYGRALAANEIESTLMNVTANISALNTAYSEGTSVQAVKESPYKVTSTVGKIQIIGLMGNERVSLFDITGRQLMFNTPKDITAKAGVYIVKIDNYNSKVVVR